MVAPVEEPPKKKSKWDDLAEAEDLQVERELKRVKKAELLQAKLSRERDTLLGRRDETRSPGRQSRAGSSGGKGDSVAPLGRTARGGMARGSRRVRDLHPALESCRSVYCYEVSRPACISEQGACELTGTSLQSSG